MSVAGKQGFQGPYCLQGLAMVTHKRQGLSLLLWEKAFPCYTQGVMIVFAYATIKSMGLCAPCQGSDCGTYIKLLSLLIQGTCPSMDMKHAHGLQMLTHTSCVK